MATLKRRSEIFLVSAHLNIVPEPAFLDLKPVLSERLARIGASLHAEEFRQLLDPVMRDSLDRGFIEAGAHEGTLWLLDEAGEFCRHLFGMTGLGVEDTAAAMEREIGFDVEDGRPQLRWVLRRLVADAV